MKFVKITSAAIMSILSLSSFSITPVTAKNNQVDAATITSEVSMAAAVTTADAALPGNRNLRGRKAKATDMHAVAPEVPTVDSSKRSLWINVDVEQGWNDFKEDAGDWIDGAIEDVGDAFSDKRSVSCGYSGGADGKVYKITPLGNTGVYLTGDPGNNAKAAFATHLDTWEYWFVYQDGDDWVIQNACHGNYVSA